MNVTTTTITQSLHCCLWQSPPPDYFDTARVLAKSLRLHRDMSVHLCASVLFPVVKLSLTGSGEVLVLEVDADLPSQPREMTTYITSHLQPALVSAYNRGPFGVRSNKFNWENKSKQHTHIPRHSKTNTLLSHTICCVYYVVILQSYIND